MRPMKVTDTVCHRLNQALRGEKDILSRLSRTEVNVRASRGNPWDISTVSADIVRLATRMHALGLSPHCAVKTVIIQQARIVVGLAPDTIWNRLRVFLGSRYVSVSYA